MMVWLYPLNKLNTAAAELVRDISVSLVQQARQIIDDLDDAVVQCQDLMEVDMAIQFTDIKTKLKKFKDLCSGYKMVFQQQLCKLLPSIRGGGKEEQELVSILNMVEMSPFQSTLISAYLNDQEKEINVLRNYLDFMKDIPVFSSSNDMIKGMLNSANDYVVVFAFSSIAKEDVYFSDMKKYLKDVSLNADKQICYEPSSSKSEQWFSGDGAALTWQNVQLFKEFKQVNKEQENSAFCIASIPNKNIRSSTIHVYEKGFQLSSEFELPSKPPVPSILYVEHDRVHLEIKPPVHGKKSVQSYIILYQTVQSSEWINVNLESDSLEVSVKDLKPNTEYRFRCRAVCCPGVSPPSDETQFFKTCPCSPPGPPKEKCLESEAITITWDIPTYIGENAEVIKYTIEYKEDIQDGKGKPWLSVNSTNRECTLKGLKNKTAYTVRVSANCAEAGKSLSSLETVLTTSDKSKSESRSQLFMEQSSVLEKGNPTIRGLELQNRYNETEDLNLCVFGRKVEATKNKVIMLVGATGSGKTTLINAMINYILGVKWEENYRYKLINEVTNRSQAEIQTMKVTSYELYNQPGFQIPYSLTIVDTPGFGDTSGIEEDTKLTEQIKKFLCNPFGIEHIDAICFVIQSSLARLSPTQKYIFDSILSIFGKDMANNIMIMATFADGKVIKALEAIKAAEVPCHKNKKGEPTHFSFNNTALYAQKTVPHQSDTDSHEDSDSDDNDDNVNDKQNAMTWTSNFKNMKTFFKTLENIESRDLKMTIQVLEERERFSKALKALMIQIKTRPCSPPGQPKEKCLESEAITITWDIPTYIGQKAEVIEYIIEYKEDTQGGKGKPWLSVNSTKRECTLKGLKKETAYTVRVSANCAKAGKSLPSLETVLTTLKSSEKPKKVSVESRSQLFLEQSSVLENGNPTIRGLKLQNRYNETEDLNLCVFGRKVEAAKNKVIMLVGATGSGKTTLINAMINYILGVKWEENYRFKLIHEVTNRSQAKSQTSKVTSYELYNQPGFQVPYSLTIVDTPGFGDTSGIEQDRKVTEQIKKFLCNPLGIEHIDAICFVIQSSLARLSPTQKYIFDSILSIFGKDMANNIMIMATFADGKDIKALEAIKEAEVPCHKTKKGELTHFSFNNTALYAQKTIPCQSDTDSDEDSDSDDDNDDNDKQNKMTWTSTFKNMKAFFKTLENIESRDLKMTIQVLEERERLSKAMKSLTPQINAGLLKMAEIESTKQLLKNEDNKMKENENFQQEIDVLKANRTNIDYVTMNCNKCLFTCHTKCYLPQEDEISTCAVMNDEGNCVKCPGRCQYSSHQLEKVLWTYETVKETKTVKEVMDNFNKAKDNYMSKKDILEELDKEHKSIQSKLIDLVHISLKCLSKLDQMALKPRSLSVAEYIDIMIKTEEDEKKPGFEERIVRLQKMKEECRNLEKLAEGENVLHIP